MKSIKRVIILSLAIILSLTSFNSLVYAEVTNEDLESLVEDLGSFMYERVKEPQVGSIGGEWAVIGLARSGYKLPKEYYEKYYENVVDHVSSLDGKLHDKKYTEYSRLIVALTAIGKDPRDVGGYNLLKALADYEKTIWQGLNGPIWALIALDSGNYEIPEKEDGKIQATRELYIQKILDSQLDDGGWSLFGGSKSSKGNEKSDPDITGMAIQALAKYQARPDVKKATDEGLICISQMQLDNGGFKSWGSENSESCVQIIVALSELGIPLEDERFIKNGNTLLDNLKSFYKEGQGFLHTHDGGGSSQMASEQGFYGIVAAKRLREGKTSLYRMSDVELATGNNKNINNRENNLENLELDLTFNDISGEALDRQDSIETLAKKGIINGRKDGVFAPKDSMTRGEFSTIIVKALDLDLVNEKLFYDVNEDDWFYPYVGAASKYGIVNGVSPNKFNPYGKITREEAVTILARLAKIKGLNTENIGNVRDVLSEFEDYVSISKWAMGSVAFFVNEGIVDSTSMDFNAKEYVNRSEVADMLFKTLEKINLI